MKNEELKKIWAEKFEQVPIILKNITQVKSVATAFNTNVDAVLKLKGADLEKLIAAENLSLRDLVNIEQTKLLTSVDVVKGIFKCFKKRNPRKQSIKS